MSANITPAHATDAYDRVGGVSEFVARYGGRHFDDPVQETVEATPLYTPEVKKPKAQGDHSELAAWLRTQTWSDFAQSLADFHETRGYLSEKQVASAISMRTKVEARNAERQAPAATQAESDGLDLTDLPSGYYGVPGGDTRLKVRVNHVTKGKWEGFTFVDDGAEYGSQQKYGMQRPDGTYKGKVEEQLRKIMADVPGALKAYGDLTGRCGVCNRKLEDETSVALGIGPVCRENLGL